MAPSALALACRTTRSASCRHRSTAGSATSASSLRGTARPCRRFRLWLSASLPSATTASARASASEERVSPMSDWTTARWLCDSARSRTARNRCSPEMGPSIVTRRCIATSIRAMSASRVKNRFSCGSALPSTPRLWKVWKAAAVATSDPRKMLRWIRSVSQAVSMFGSDFQSAPFSKSERKACSNLAHGIAFSAPKWRVQKVSRLAVEWSGVQEKPIVLLLRSIGLSPRISRCVTRMGNVVLDLLLVGVFGYTNRRHDRACGLDRSDSGSARTSAASSASSKYCEMAASRLCIPKAQAVERSDGSFNESVMNVH
mmetsp:Transcript_3448/g.10824  ORF Transcript_3448/g.10824 Transcript_3448/m.10824 type:complete len:315 (-) Transcript_3448:107-1051(-)